MRRRLMMVCMLAGILAGLPSSAPAQQAPAPAATLAREIAALVNQQTALIMKRDAAGLAALFTEDGIYVAADGGAFAGRMRIQQYYVQLFALLAQLRPVMGDVVRQNRIEQVVPVGDGAWAFGRGTNLTSGSAGVVQTTDHWVAIYARVNGAWKIRVMSVGEDAPRDP